MAHVVQVVRAAGMLRPVSCREADSERCSPGQRAAGSSMTMQHRQVLCRLGPRRFSVCARLLKPHQSKSIIVVKARMAIVRHVATLYSISGRSATCCQHISFFEPYQRSSSTR